MRFLIPPPRGAWSDELNWVVSRACARTSDDRASAPGDPASALAIARRLQLSGRIAARLGQDACRRELGQYGDACFEDYLTNVAVASALFRARSQVCTIAARVSVPIVWLKFAALSAGALIEAGSRVAGDIDLLVEEADSERLWRALRENGFKSCGTRAHPHQLEALVDSAGAVVEIHTHLPGVTVTAGRFARARDLRRAGLVRELVAAPLRLEIPSPAILAAHALAHGLLQNAATPQSYSPWRMLGDAIDLRRHRAGALAEAEKWLDQRLGPDLALVVEQLCEALENGLAERLLCGAPAEVPLVVDSEAGLLLRHCLAARLDEDYSESLRALGLSYVLEEGGLWRVRGRRVLAALLPAPAELDALYGAAPSRLERARQRVKRPFDLAARSLSRWRRRSGR